MGGFWRREEGWLEWSGGGKGRIDRGGTVEAVKVCLEKYEYASRPSHLLKDMTGAFTSWNAEWISQIVCILTSCCHHSLRQTLSHHFIVKFIHVLKLPCANSSAIKTSPALSSRYPVTQPHSYSSYS
jgi:hypothetical protein